MTEGTTASDISTQSQASVAPTVTQSTDQAPSAAPVQTGTVETQKQDKVFYQDDVNKLIGKIRQETREQTRREALQEMQLQQFTQPQQAAQPAQQQVQQQTQQAPVQQPQQPPQQNYLTEENARQMFAHELERQRQQAIATQIAYEFNNKLNLGAAKYADYEEKVAPLRQVFNNGQLLPLVYLANGVENTADVMYDLAQNPQKIANIVSLAQQAPILAQQAINQVSQSIKLNESAAQQKTAAEPLSQIRPSTTGTNDGSMSVKDYRRLLTV